MATRKTQQELQAELEQAATQVKVNSEYVHYKSDRMRYRVVDLAIDTSTDSVCVIYQALYDEGLLFVRSLSEWLDEVTNSEGEQVPRFTLVG